MTLEHSSSPESHSCCAHHDHHHDLVISDLSVHYRTLTALENISLNTSCGNRLALIGSNGAGKSTLLKSIAGLVKKTTGTIQWRGTAIKQWSSEFAYLPQREEIDWNFPITVRGLVEMGRYPHIGLWRKYSDKDAEAVDQAIESLNLTDIQDRQISQLSAGQQQRSFIARAVAQNAHALLLDEPFNGLDRNAAETLSQLMHKLASEGRLIIASHHDLNTAHSLFNQVLLLNKTAQHFGNTTDILTEENLSNAFA